MYNIKKRIEIQVVILVFLWMLSLYDIFIKDQRINSLQIEIFKQLKYTYPPGIIMYLDVTLLLRTEWKPITLFLKEELS